MAERRWRSQLAAAGFPVAPVAVPVHPSVFLTPGGDVDAAIAAYEEFLREEPGREDLYPGIDRLLLVRGRREEARIWRRRAHEARARTMGLEGEEIDRAVAYLAAADGDGEAPSAVPPAFVARHFDGCAAVFDGHMLGKLSYAGPPALARMVRQALVEKGRPASDLRVLDLGCGTGLSGWPLRPIAAHLVGVDLSPGMLAQAKRAGIYDRLERAECVAFLRATEERFDVVASCDVTTYIGALGPSCAAAHAALAPGGVLAFTAVAGAADSGPVLGAAGRYRHGLEYLLRTLAEAGLEDARHETIDLRTEAGVPVRAHVVAALRRD